MLTSFFRDSGKMKKKLLFSTNYNMEFSLLSESDSYLFYCPCIYFLSEFRYVLEAYRCNSRLEFTQVINFYSYVSPKWKICVLFLWGRPLNGKSLPRTVWYTRYSVSNTHKYSHVVVMVTGDPATFIVSLHQALKGYNCPADWVDMLKERDIEKEKANR